MSSLRCLSVGAFLSNQIGPSISSFIPTMILGSKTTSILSFKFYDQQISSSKSQSRRLASDSTKGDESFPTWTFDKPCKSMVWTDIPPLRLTISGTTADAENADLIILGVMSPIPKDDEETNETGDSEMESLDLVGVTKAVDKNLNGALSDLIAENGKSFKNGAKIGSMTPTLRTVGANAKRYVVLGMGPERTKDGAVTDWTACGLSLGKSIADKLNSEAKIKSVNILLPQAFGSNSTTIQDFATSFYENMYIDNRYRSGTNVKKFAEDLEVVNILVEGCDDAQIAQLQNCIHVGKKIASGVFMTKDIVNAPHNVLNSESLADTAKRLADDSRGRLTCIILDKSECEKRGMGAFLGVARGSETEPQFIHLIFTPPSGLVRKKIAVIGKGLLFDTGGYNIKTQMMEYMKFDCGGAAAVLGAARTIAEIAPDGVEVHFIVAACENMISGKAMVPSDILTASNGKTIEVMNTDAEGRLTLADALVYADKELDCEAIVELSTLTGACMVALGKGICGFWTGDENLAKQLEFASKLTGEKAWRMPLPKEYREELDSTFADIKNVGTRYGGAITAALFLNEFVSKKKPFAHIDIAGPVWNDKTGATGFGVKIITEWIKQCTVHE